MFKRRLLQRKGKDYIHNTEIGAFEKGGLKSLALLLATCLGLVGLIFLQKRFNTHMHGIFKRIHDLNVITGTDGMVILKQPDGSEFRRQVYHLFTTTDRVQFTTEMNDSAKSRIIVHERPLVNLMYNN